MKVVIDVSKLIERGIFPWHLTPFIDRPTTYTPRFATLCRIMSRYVDNVDLKRVLSGGGTITCIKQALKGSYVPMLDKLINNPEYGDNKGHFDGMSETRYLVWLDRNTPFTKDMSELLALIHVSGKFVFPADYVEYVEVREEQEFEQTVAL